MSAIIHRLLRNDRFLDISGQIFEVTNIAISCVDVVSDLLVAYEFYQRGFTLWCTLVCISLVISNIMYGFLFVDEMLPFIVKYQFQRYWGRRHKHQVWAFNGARFTNKAFVVAMILVFPFAQAVPMVHWLLIDSEYFQTCRKHCGLSERVPSANSDQHDSWGSPQTQDSTAAQQEFTAELDEKTKLLRRCNRAIDGHMRKHAAFYIETVVESIPQSLIQLVAISYIGETTGLQNVSLALSVFSIVSKAYVISNSWHITLFSFSFLVVVHDVFNIFFMSSTVLAHTEPAEVEVFGGVQVSTLSSWWFFKEKIIIAYGILCLFLFLAGCLVKELVRRVLKGQDIKIQWQDVGIACVYVLVGSCLFFPFVIAVESLKLSVLALILLVFSSAHHKFPVWASLSAFLHVDDKEEELRRWKHLMYWAVNFPVLDKKTKKPCTQDSTGSYAPTVHHRRRRKRAAPTTTGNTIEWVQRDIRNMKIRKEALEHKDGFSPYNIMWIELTEAIGPIVTIFRERDWRKIYTAVEKVATDMYSAVKQDKENLFVGIFMAMLFAIPFMLIGSILFGVAFPLLHAMQYYHLHSGLQTFCLCGTTLSLAVIIAMLPKVVKLLFFCAIVETMQSPVGVKAHLEGIHIVIEQYFTPSSRQVLLSYIPLHLIPGDVVGVSAKFLDFRDLNMANKKIKDFTAIREDIGDM